MTYQLGAKHFVGSDESSHQWSNHKLPVSSK
ncbi:hypothetical protein CLV72_105265 [Allonocardiopsis opalescens]|uniref:Uncharacterized protein n=1 Tax=Allonocardiopsis opalescens TaxID=1144618 RepID=A0A2T0Q284_9ACTN|nr:hypothetical protein CLV72_105265 [Allonocardiopsis opalescens]